MSGNLYQLRTEAPVGAAVTINGPYDKYGFVVARRDSGHHLIRGTGSERPARTTYTTEASK